jgi:hypothetical protein
MSQATTQVKKVKGEGFKWGQELLKAKAIIAEQEEIMKKQQEQIEALKAELEHLKTDCVKAFELLDSREGYYVCTPQNIISQEEEEDCLYWGATNGYLTIFRLPKSVNVPDDCDFGDAFGNKWCLGEEWGGLTKASFQTITQEMIDNENFEQEQGYSDSEDDSDNEDLECAAWCKPIREGKEPEERDADEFLSTKQKCPSCELERQEIIAEKASDETEEGCCTNCGVFLDEDMHIFCYSRGDEEETMCCECGQDLHEEMKADGWKRDDDSEDEE